MFMNIFGGKTRRVLAMRSSQGVTCAKVRTVRVMSVQQGTGGPDYFPSTLFPDNPRADWPSAPNRRPRCGQSEALAKPCPPGPHPSVHVFRHDTPVAFIGSCSLGDVFLDEAAQPARSPVIDFFSFSRAFIFGGRF